MKERLRKIRESLGKTQKEMSAFLGLGEITWQNYERGISKPKLTIMEKLALLGFDIAWLTTGKGNMFVSGVRENTNSDFESNNSNVDKMKIFSLLLNELGQIYSKDELKNKPDNFIAMRAFEITVNILSHADSNTTAVSMVQLMIEEEKKNKK